MWGVLVVVLRHTFGFLRGEAARRWPAISWICRKPLPPPIRLRIALEELGGTFIKFGQMLALQPDILSLQYCNALFDLLDRVAPLPYPEVARVFEEETGISPDLAFDSIDHKPLATASIGQVHTAWLDGRKLAVKVQRPSVEHEFVGDVRLMSAIIRAIRVTHLRPLQWMIEPLSEFVSWTKEELDFRREASYMRKLRENAADNPNEKVPELLEEFVTRRTLVMEFLEGRTVLAYLRALEQDDAEAVAAVEAGGFDSHAVASHIVDNFLGDVFQHGLFHADLHPANLMILADNVVGYIDFGITGTISSYSRQNLVALTLAYVDGDLQAMADAFFRVSTMDSPDSPKRFHDGLSRSARTWYEKDGRGLKLRKNFTLVMLDMLHLSRESGVWPERDVIKYIRSAIAIDGLITRFAPTFDLGCHLHTTCDRYLKWNLRRTLFTLHNLIGWTSASMRLFLEGGPRTVATLARLGGVPPLPGLPETGRQRRPQLVFPAGFLAAACLAAWLSPEPLRIGANLFTAEVALACLALTRLWSTFATAFDGE